MAVDVAESVEVGVALAVIVGVTVEVFVGVDVRVALGVIVRVEVPVWVKVGVPPQEQAEVKLMSSNQVETALGPPWLNTRRIESQLEQRALMAAPLIRPVVTYCHPLVMAFDEPALTFLVGLPPQLAKAE